MKEIIRKVSTLDMFAVASIMEMQLQHHKKNEVRLLLPPSCFKDPSLVCFIAERDEKPVGYVVGSPMDKTLDNEALIQIKDHVLQNPPYFFNPKDESKAAFTAQIVVVEECRRQGLASRLYDLFFDEMQKREVVNLFAEVDVGDAASEKLHRNMGFEVINSGVEGHNLHTLRKTLLF